MPSMSDRLLVVVVVANITKHYKRPKTKVCVFKVTNNFENCTGIMLNTLGKVEEVNNSNHHVSGAHYKMTICVCMCTSSLNASCQITYLLTYLLVSGKYCTAVCVIYFTTTAT